MTPSKPPELTQWIVFVMVTLLLWALLVIKFTGRQDLFSYQGVKPETPWFALYSSGVQTINNWLKSGSGNVWSALKNGVGLLQESYRSTKDKNLLGALSWQLRKAQSLELVVEAQACFDMLETGFTTMGNIVQEYQSLLDNYQTVSTQFSVAIGVLPNSSTKECLQSYLDNLKTSFESLVLVYKNIDTLSQSLNGLIVNYSQSLGSCDSLWLVVGRITSLYSSMQQVNGVLEQVKKNLDTHSVDNYNKLCQYGTVQWLTWLQAQSWNLIKVMDSLPQAGLEKVNNIDSYLEKLKQQTTTTTASGSSRLQKLLHN